MKKFIIALIILLALCYFIPFIKWIIGGFALLFIIGAVIIVSKIKKMLF